MCLFPNIQYLPDYAIDNGDDNVLPPSCQGLYTILVNNDIIPPDFLNGINNKTLLENAIIGLIDNYPENQANLESIFHMIQIWGGRTIRRFYTNQALNWHIFLPLYVDFVNSIRDIPENYVENYFQYCEIAYNTCLNFYHAIRNAGYRYLGVAFITKHAHFWMHRNNPDNMLPIYDSTFAVHITQEGNNASFGHLQQFWIAMHNQAEVVGVGLTALERQLFAHFHNNQEHVQVNGGVLEDGGINLSVYDGPGPNYGKTFQILNQHIHNEALSVFLVYNDEMIEARVQTYNHGHDTLRGAKTIKRFIDAHQLRPGQPIQCTFENENGRHRYIIETLPEQSE